MRSKILVAALSAATLMPVLPISANAQEGHASWYALRSQTASGEMMNPSAMTAAHRSLPFGTRVRVENLNNGRSAVVRINDRGPFIRGRIIDVSKAAASQLGFVGAGTARVRITSLGSGGGGERRTASTVGRSASSSSFGGGDTTFRDRQRASASPSGGKVVWVDGKPAFGG